ncbi:uncharacterized protein JN550_002685 [Neoarthrinium moseri]|uniref:uncharacterized protein n=1 Tax=Neoarthrinium moseri TaxID=1658444 RepID=UPI001FDE19C4|nr:uncharacterized protein JN550_002685 [Neoarthrinium moseri]KAI1874106.1 hypothetical protein JN550_002685 [Neoarthrinium moseri]
MSTMLTILIVHGGWHKPQHYDELKKLLEEDGYEVHVPRLPSSHESRPPNYLSDDTKFVRSSVEKLVRDGRKVVVLMDSYGGQVGSNGLYGLGQELRSTQGHEGGVSRLIYMTAYALPEGVTMMDKPLVVGPGRDNAEIEAYISAMVQYNGRCMYQPSDHAAWWEIPVSYIYTSADMTVSLNYQQNFVQGLKKEGREVQTFELATGHCPNFTATKEVADIVKKNAL